MNAPTNESTKNKHLACIFARGGSKGLPDKNIRDFAGKPLIAWAIEHALALETVDEIIVSTDSAEIAEIARSCGASVPFIRPSELAKDDSPEWMAWRHLLNYILERDGILPEVMLSVPTTAPLRLVEDIQRCLDAFEIGVTDAIVTVTDAHRSPYFNMVKLDPLGYAEVVISDDGDISRRQDSPSVFDMTTAAYVVNAEFIMQNNGLFEGRVRAVHLPIERAIDIDTLLDFEYAEFLFQKRASK
jgi:CMP-N-acetylneuraminic acid synthetase